MRTRLVVGNWKMHGSLGFVEALLADLLEQAAVLAEGTQVGVCPTFLHLPKALEMLSGSGIKVGAQNAHPEAQGAFTGEVSAAMLADAGVDMVLVGHSERRQLFGESDALVADKFAAVASAGMRPVLCLGETLEQRQQGVTADTVLGQLQAVIDRVGKSGLQPAVIAYEPVWAIGTGQTATPEQAQEVHALIRKHLAEQDPDQARMMPILYGGSVKSGNAGELFAQQDIDGGLVGGASLKAEEFIAICKA